MKWKLKAVFLSVAMLVMPTAAMAEGELIGKAVIRF